MDLDFSLLLVIATGVTGVVWALDKFWLRKRRQKRVPSPAPGAIVEYSNSFFPVLLFVLVLRSFVFEPFQIPSGSMLPTLKIGDFILVNKFTYGLRLPVGNQKVVDLGEPERGDVMVFRFPLDPSINYIKRVIGVPGDQISYIGKQLVINGQPVDKELLMRSPTEAPGETLYQETLPNVVHQVYNTSGATLNLKEITVPDGYYMVMGDNRDHSNDSRFWCQHQSVPEIGCIPVEGRFFANGVPLVIGFVPEHNIVGQAVAVWMHWPKLTSLPSFTDVRLIN